MIIMFWLSLLVGGSLSRLRNIWFHRQLKYSSLIGVITVYLFLDDDDNAACCFEVLVLIIVLSLVWSLCQKNVVTKYGVDTVGLVIIVVCNILFLVITSNKWPVWESPWTLMWKIYQQQRKLVEDYICCSGKAGQTSPGVAVQGGFRPFSINLFWDPRSYEIIQL